MLPTSQAPAGVLVVMRSVFLAAVVLLVAVTAAVVQAQGTSPKDPRAAQPERPTVATHAYTVAPGIVELETGGLHQTLGASASLIAVPALFKIGLGARVQLDVSPGWLQLNDHGVRKAGLTDLAFALKVRVLDEHPVLGTFAVQPGASVATGSVEDGTGIGTGSVGLIVISSRSLGPVALDLNAGYSHRGGDGSIVPKDATVWTISTGFPVAGRLGWCAELFGYPRTHGLSGEPGIVGFLTGPILTLHKSLIADAGVVLDVTGLGGTQIYAGVTWNMGHAWTPRPAAAPSR
jgi:hypothetical protein